MKVESVEVIPYAMQFKEPYETVRGRLEQREMVLLRVRTADGIQGLGEAVPLSLRGGASLEQVVGELEGFGELLGDAGRWPPEDAPGPVRDAVEGLSAPAACAVRTARLDIEAREQGVPAWSALGAGSWEALTCNATLPAGSPAATAARAEDWAADGFHAFKLKVGMEGDVEAVAVLRGAIGSEGLIRVDANGAWSVREAAKALTEIEPHGIELVEQPVETLKRMAKLRGRTEIPVAADESVASPDDAREAVELEACELVGVKLSKVGGHAAALAIAEQIPAYLSSALDGPVGIAAAVHVAQALRERGGDAGIAHGLATQRLFTESIATLGCELTDDQLRPPPGAGLGVEINDAALERHRL